MINAHDIRDTCELALIDIDGTLCNGTVMIAGADLFIRRLRSYRIQPVFFTNNSTRTPREVIVMLGNMGIEAHTSEVCTSAQAAANYLLAQFPKAASICFVGQSGLREALLTCGFDARHASVAEAEFLQTARGAVVGLDFNVDYRALEKLCQVVYRQQHFVLTNADVRLMSETGFRPGNGSLGAFVATATGVQPVVTGKPEASFVNFALKRYGVAAHRAVIVGDNVKTDVQAGRRAGVRTIWVKSGIHYSGNDMAETQADIVANSVADLFL